jgi:hypothetical protein
VFAIAWLNLAIQPCLMAMEVTPASVVDAAHAAHMEHANQSPDHDCDHCPPVLSDQSKICASAAASDCSSIPDYNYDGRNGSAKFKDIPTYVAIVDRAIPFEFTIPTDSPPSVDCAAPDHPNEPPLNIRFCVFLK